MWDRLNWLKNKLDEKGGCGGCGYGGKKWVEKPYKYDRKQSLLNKMRWLNRFLCLI